MARPAAEMAVASPSLALDDDGRESRRGAVEDLAVSGAGDRPDGVPGTLPSGEPDPTAVHSPGIPMSLRIVAVLFLADGVGHAAGVCAALAQGRLSLDVEVFYLPIAFGLWRLRPGWRTCALVTIWFGLIVFPFALLWFLAAPGALELMYFSQKFQDVPGVASGWTALEVWQLSVLTRPSIRTLFGVGDTPIGVRFRSERTRKAWRLAACPLLVLYTWLAFRTALQPVRPGDYGARARWNWRSVPLLVEDAGERKLHDFFLVARAPAHEKERPTMIGGVIVPAEDRPSVGVDVRWSAPHRLTQLEPYDIVWILSDGIERIQEDDTKRHTLPGQVLLMDKSFRLLKRIELNEALCLELVFGNGRGKYWRAAGFGENYVSGKKYLSDVTARALRDVRRREKEAE